MQKFISSLLLLLPFLGYTQTLYHSTYSWEKNPKVYVPAEQEKKYSLLIVLENNITEVAYESDGQAVIYETVHRIFHVSSADAVDRVNKSFFRKSNLIEEIDLKARCIAPDGKIIPFNKSTVKSVDDYEDMGPCTIFPIDGVEAGCDVEILYTLKKHFYSYSYSQINSTSPVLKFEAHILSPKNLVFETKSYNALGNFKAEKSDSTKNHLYLVQLNAPPAKKEKYSAGSANAMSYIQQLSYNTDKKKARLTSWDEIAQDYYTSIYKVEKNEQHTIEKMLAKEKITGIEGAAEKLLALDSFFKTNFEINDQYDFNLGKGLDLRKMSELNTLRFYVTAYKLLGINFETAVTTKRDQTKFDPKFPSYFFTKEFLFYLPAISGFVSPLSIFSRPGYPDPDVLNNDGLFIKEVNIGDISSATSKIKPIAATNYTSSYHNTDVKAFLDFSARTSRLEVEQSLFGYSAFYLQPIYRYLKPEQKEDISKAYYLSTNSEGVKNPEVKNTSEEHIYKLPLQFKYTVEQNDYLQNAGPKFIFKVGLCIGEQSELYEEETRSSPAETNYTHYLKRSIEITLPAGYKATNLDDLKINKQCLIGGAEAAVFKSDYELKDNKITVSVYEDYRVIDYPLSVYNDFKAVINAAADFNKKTIVFEKL